MLFPISEPPQGRVRESWPGNSHSRPELRPLPTQHAVVPTALAPGHAAPSAGVFESSIRKGPPGTQQARTLEFEENLNQTKAIKENKEQEGHWAVKSSPRPTPRPLQTRLSSPVSPVRRERVSRHYRVPISPAIVPPPSSQGGLPSRNPAPTACPPSLEKRLQAQGKARGSPNSTPDRCLPPRLLLR